MSIINVNIVELPEADTIPAGEYAFRIDGVSEVKKDKNGSEFVSLEYTVMDGEYEGRKVFEPYIRLAGASTLRKLLKACNYQESKLPDSDDLLGLEFSAAIKVQEARDQFDASNRIAHYLVPNKPVKAPTKGRR